VDYALDLVAVSSVPSARLTRTEAVGVWVWRPQSCWRWASRAYLCVRDALDRLDCGGELSFERLLVVDVLNELEEVIPVEASVWNVIVHRRGVLLRRGDSLLVHVGLRYEHCRPVVLEFVGMWSEVSSWVTWPASED